MTLRVLYIGGTGQISLPCVEASVAAGHSVTVLNRGRTSVPLPDGVETLVGDMDAETYAALGDRSFDVVAQFRLYTPEQMQRDIATFTGRTGQYVFISSASVYEKPVRHYLMTERTPQSNPFWEYSRHKIACELLLRDQNALAYTIVRPSHTVRTGMPIQVGDPDNAIRRMLARKPVIVAGDGSSLWTLTRSDDVARAFVRLLGNSRALGEDFQITTDRGFTWNQIHEAIARGFDVEADPRPRPDLGARRLQPGVGRPAPGRQDLVGALRQQQGQGRRRAVRRVRGSRRDPPRLDHARQGAPEGAAASRRSRGRRADRPHHRRPVRRAALTIAAGARPPPCSAIVGSGQSLIRNPADRFGETRALASATVAEVRPGIRAAGRHARIRSDHPESVYSGEDRLNCSDHLQS